MWLLLCITNPQSLLTEMEYPKAYGQVEEPKDPLQYMLIESNPVSDFQGIETDPAGSIPSRQNSTKNKML